LTDKVALVTTAEKGIGPCQALGLAEAGADVVVTGDDLEETEKIADQIRAMGRKTLVSECDVPREASVRALVKGTWPNSWPQRRRIMLLGKFFMSMAA
jgi:NAD(P)-dependent dehydrogenase (short-subunit alcohol dehydrogenase family)